MLFKKLQKTLEVIVTMELIVVGLLSSGKLTLCFMQIVITN